MDIKKYNEIRNMYKIKNNGSPFNQEEVVIKENSEKPELGSTTMDWSLLQPKEPRWEHTPSDQEGFGKLTDEMSKLGKRIRDAGGWKAYFGKDGDEEEATGEETPSPENVDEEVEEINKQETQKGKEQIKGIDFSDPNRHKHQQFQKMGGPPEEMMG